MARPLRLVYLATAAGGRRLLVSARLRAHGQSGVSLFPPRLRRGRDWTRCSTPIKRPLPVTPLNLLFALVPLSLEPDRFDSFSHQFGPIFLLFLPAFLL